MLRSRLPLERVFPFQANVPTRFLCPAILRTLWRQRGTRAYRSATSNTAATAILQGSKHQGAERRGVRAAGFRRRPLTNQGPKQTREGQNLVFASRPCLLLCLSAARPTQRFPVAVNCCSINSTFRGKPPPFSAVGCSTPRWLLCSTPLSKPTTAVTLSLRAVGLNKAEPGAGRTCGT